MDRPTNDKNVLKSNFNPQGKIAPKNELITVDTNDVLDNQPNEQTLINWINTNPEIAHDKNSNNETWLHYAALKGYKNAAAALIEKRADINAQNINGITPLMTAVQNGHVETVKLLLRAGTNVRIPDKTGLTPLVFVNKNLEKPGMAEIKELFFAPAPSAKSPIAENARRAYRDEIILNEKKAPTVSTIAPTNKIPLTDDQRTLIRKLGPAWPQVLSKCTIDSNKLQLGNYEQLKKFSSELAPALDKLLGIFEDIGTEHKDISKENELKNLGNVKALFEKYGISKDGLKETITALKKDQNAYNRLAQSDTSFAIFSQYIATLDEKKADKIEQDVKIKESVPLAKLPLLQRIKKTVQSWWWVKAIAYLLSNTTKEPVQKNDASEKHIADATISNKENALTQGSNEPNEKEKLMSHEILQLSTKDELKKAGYTFEDDETEEQKITTDATFMKDSTDTINEELKTKSLLPTCEDILIRLDAEDTPITRNNLLSSLAGAILAANPNKNSLDNYLNAFMHFAHPAELLDFYNDHQVCTKALIDLSSTKDFMLTDIQKREIQPIITALKDLIEDNSVGFTSTKISSLKTIIDNFRNSPYKTFTEQQRKNIVDLMIEPLKNIEKLNGKVASAIITGETATRRNKTVKELSKKIYSEIKTAKTAELLHNIQIPHDINKYPNKRIDFSTLSPDASRSHSASVSHPLKKTLQNRPQRSNTI